MGCKCANGGIVAETEKKDELFTRENIIKNEKQKALNPFSSNLEISKNDSQISPFQQEKPDNNEKYLDYPQKIVDLINKIREDPASYAEVIEDAINYISERNDIGDSLKTKLIFKKKVKVALNRGEPAFKEAVEELKKLDPMPQLVFDNDLCLELPETEDEVRDPKFLKSRVNKLRENNKKVDVFFKDLVKVPEVSGLLMIVDDNGKNAGKKRGAILNKELRYVGVSCKFIGQLFVAYFAFSE